MFFTANLFKSSIQLLYKFIQITQLGIVSLPTHKTDCTVCLIRQALESPLDNLTVHLLIV
jgi:hypothetical protein